MTRLELVAVGASWGGLHAIEIVLGCLPEDFGAAVAVSYTHLTLPTTPYV